MITVDCTLWPIVVVTLPPVATDEEVRDYLEQLRVCRDRRSPYAIIVDANASRGFTANQRRMQAEHISQGMDLSRRYLRAFAFVAASALQRGMLTAIFWLRAPEWPHQVFGTVVEAKEWARSLVFRDGPAP